MMIVRAMIGPSHYDRILAANSFGTKTVLLLALMGFLFGRPAFSRHRDLVYALINFVTTIALMKFFRYRTLARPLGAIGARRAARMVEALHWIGGAFIVGAARCCQFSARSGCCDFPMSTRASMRRA
jgi:multicomponent Na+:H+ antiporter subunit F